MYQCLGASLEFSLQYLPKETTQLGLSHLFIHCITCHRICLPFPVCYIWFHCRGPNFTIFSPSSLIDNLLCVHLYMVGPHPFHGGWPQLCFPSRKYPRWATHLATMPLEPLINVVNSSASSATLVFVHFRGDVPYTNLSKIADTLYLV